VLKVADFGLSNLIVDGQGFLTSCGSPNYAAPEIIEGVLYDGAAADMWSCGVILYVLLNRSLPFEADSITGLFAQIRATKFEMPAFLSSEA